MEELEALKKSKECKRLDQELKALRKSFDELEASHECLKEGHEDLEIAHTRIKEAHSTLLELVKEKDIMLEKLKKKSVEEQVIMTCDIGLTCDLIDESIIVESTNPSCSASTSTSTISDGLTCDASLIVENENLKKEVNKLNRALGKAYGGKDRLLMSLGSQRASLHEEGLGYTPKKGKAVFASHKTHFVFCSSCKQVGHLEHACTKKKAQALVSSIKVDSFYVLIKGTSGVKAKFVGAP
jgi:hypothetical protein